MLVNPELLSSSNTMSFPTTYDVYLKITQNEFANEQNKENKKNNNNTNIPNTIHNIRKHQKQCRKFIPR